MTDLFPVKQTIKQRITGLAERKGFINSVDIENLKDDIRHKEGNVKGLLRIHRTARDLAKSGVLRRLEPEEKTFRGFPNPTLATFEFVGVK